MEGKVLTLSYGNDFEGYYGDDSIYNIKCRRLYFTVWNIINQFS